jgi:hypothetical protein
MSRRAGSLANRASQGILQNRELLVAERAKNDLAAVMSTAEGRRFVWALIEHAGVYGPSYASEALATAYNEGRRSIGIGLQARCQADVPDLYVTALKEQLTELRAEAITRHAAAEAAPEELDQ